MKQVAEPFVMLPRSLLASKAWQSIGLPTRRFIDFLMLEHMRHGGQRNGFLTAPRRQLWAFGIWHHAVSKAIDEADRVGLVDCIRGTGRAPNRYTLTWLRLADGTQPTNRWQQFDGASAAEREGIAQPRNGRRRQVSAKPRSRSDAKPATPSATKLPTFTDAAPGGCLG